MYKKNILKFQGCVYYVIWIDEFLNFGGLQGAYDTKQTMNYEGLIAKLLLHYHLIIY